jgi:hypothetical protein
MTVDGVVPICCSNGLSDPSGYRRVDTIGMVVNPSMCSSPDPGPRGAATEGVVLRVETGAAADATVGAVDAAVVAGTARATSDAITSDGAEPTAGKMTGGVGATTVTGGSLA